MTTTTGRRVVAPVGSETHVSGCPATGIDSKSPASGGVGCGETIDSPGRIQVRRALERLRALELSEAPALLGVTQVFGAVETDDCSSISESSFEATRSFEANTSLARLAV